MVLHAAHLETVCRRSGKRAWKSRTTMLSAYAAAGRSIHPYFCRQCRGWHATTGRWAA